MTISKMLLTPAGKFSYFCLMVLGCSLKHMLVLFTGGPLQVIGTVAVEPVSLPVSLTTGIN
jgi:hypothetical protein